ncbi:hypothetical protein AAHA92_29865 [Salvia divinorum]|uniref:Uncharacterized protein n=1 Tax=Salvia divinorum TaxID=28513 RepID=A0ABD1FZS0_SALDI
MGNCCRHESWASLDEWENEWAEHEEDASLPSMVKIKITKTELEGLLAAARLHNLPVERLFISDFQRRHPWAPSLHTISE